jgi:murein DD-endopeptidase MepM/ murein hydrolase activator NlpD
VSPGRRRARRAIGVGLLVPGLVLVSPPGAGAAEVPVKAPEKQPGAKAKTPARRAAAPAESPGEPCVHVVRSGESVSRLAVRYRVPRQRIIDTNRLARPETLRVGQRLTVPGCAQGPAVGTAVAEAVPQPDGSLVALVGPRRVPTRLYLDVPEFGRAAIDFIWPVIGPVVSSVGRRRSGWHAGIDIRAEAGTPVHAAAPGTVSFSGWARAYGHVVMLEHSNDFVTIYAHNLQNMVNVGDTIDAGTVIASVGRSGRATAHHLHFEIRHAGLVYNPLFLLPRRDLVMAGAGELPEPAEEDDEDE